MTKGEIRRQIKASVAAMSGDERASQARTLLEAISGNSHFAAAKRVLIYNPLSDEIDVLPILEKYKSAKEFYMPVVDGDILRILPYTEEQRTGAYNISEPVGSDYVTIDTIDLVIVPGVGFTKDGHRLGRGKGFYDKLLGKASCYKIGVCHSVQICAGIASLCEEHDVKMNEVISPNY